MIDACSLVLQVVLLPSRIRCLINKEMNVDVGKQFTSLCYEYLL